MRASKGIFSRMASISERRTEGSGMARLRAQKGSRLFISTAQQEVHPLWLRLNDPGEHTRNRQRLFEMRSVIENPACWQVAKSWEEDARSLEVEWADGHHSSFPLDWLKAQITPNRLESEYWHAGFTKFVPDVDYAELESSEGKQQISVHLARYGLAILRNVPLELGMVEHVGNSIGNVRVTNYGSSFDVIDLGENGNNLAQTNCAIPAHTDNPYRDPFPGVQLLHCLENASEGGGTTFVDGFAAAESLRREDPTAFALLSQTPHPFEYVDPECGVLLHSEVPVLSLDSTGNLVRVAFNNRSAVPLQGSPSQQGYIEEYYRAWAKFDALCNDPQRYVTIQLRPGDLAIFLNNRILHGREEYSPGGKRHMQGAYVDHDALHSHVSVALRNNANIQKLCVYNKAAETSLAALSSQSEFSYGEGIHMLEHAMQGAVLAEQNGESPEAILACLFHDVGNSPQAREAWVCAGHAEPELIISSADSSIGYRDHDRIGAHYLETLGFSAEVSGSVGLHVQAKRALVKADPSYMQCLSQASIETLADQGGPMSDAELAEFLSLPGSSLALKLRRYDDDGKAPDMRVPALEEYRERIVEHLRQQAM
jgi:gamma-butyrobetaine dioxygenase